MTIVAITTVQLLLLKIVNNNNNNKHQLLYNCASLLRYHAVLFDHEAEAVHRDRVADGRVT